MANNKKSKKKIIIFSIIGAVLIILTLVVVLGSKKAPVYNVQTEMSQRRNITQVVTATGKIYPEVQVTISPEVSGEVIGLPVREGYKVNRGDLLLKIKPDIYAALRDRSNAELSSARANLQKYESDNKRASELFEKGLISTAELEQSNTMYEMAKAQYDQADAALKQAVENLSKTTIYAPMTGTVSALNVELGERVLGTSQFQGTTVMSVADLSKMEGRVDVGENDIILISIGDTARIEVDALQNKKLNGLVYEIGNTAKTKGLGTQEEVTNFEVKIRIIEKGTTLRPGMSMTATIETETRKNVITVPIQSVTTRSSTKEKENQPRDESDQMAANDTRIKQKVEKVKEIVFLIENNVAKAHEITRGISDDSYTEIASGLEENKEVVSGSYKAINRELEDGVKVKIDNIKKKSKDSEPK
jgi:HlyD family secretion protein